MSKNTFRDRNDAARQLAGQLQEQVPELHEPLVLGIPRGGVITAAALARELDAELDVALSRKLRHPRQPELAIGAISEDGEVYLEPRYRQSGLDEQYLEEEKKKRMTDLDQRRRMFRDIRAAAQVEGRSVILTDDGIATGSTMFAALHLVKAKQPRETIVAVPIAPPGRFDQFRDACDHAVALMLPERFMAIGQFYEDFRQVDDEQVCEVLRQFAESTS